MRKFLVFLLVLLVIGVGLDIGGRALAESKIGETIATQSGITPAPDVDIHGFSFLWQVVDGNYENITLTFADVDLGPLAGVSAVADAYDISLPLSEAVGGNIDNLTAGRADVRAVIPPAALIAALGTDDLTVARGTGDAIRFGTTLAAAGKTFAIAAEVTPTLSDGVLRLGDPKLVGDAAGVPAALTTPFLQDLAVDVPLDGLPFELQSGSVRFEDAGLVIAGQARDVPVGQLIRAAG